jgi:hypothetical protein
LKERIGMFDGDPIEVGKASDRFLTEESGRRVYFPSFGPARVVPSRDREAKLREAQFFVFIAGMVSMMVAAAARAYMPQQSFPILEGWIMLLMLGSREFITSRLVRRWSAIDPRDLSYARYVMASHAKRSLIGLSMAIAMRAILFIGLIVALAWLATHPPPGWDDWTRFKKVSWAAPFMLLIVAASYAGTSCHRAVAALIDKYRRR